MNIQPPKGQVFPWFRTKKNRKSPEKQLQMQDGDQKYLQKTKNFCLAKQKK